MSSVIPVDNSFVHVFSDQLNKVEVTKNHEVKLRIHRTADAEVAGLVDALHKLQFADSQESDLDNWVLTIKMDKIDLSDRELQEASRPGKDRNLELVKLVAGRIKKKLVAENAQAINVFVNTQSAVVPLTEEEQIYRNVLEKYYEMDGELVSKTDGSTTGMTPATVKQMIHEGLESKKIPKFEELPILSPHEAEKTVSRFKEGQFLLARSKNDDKQLLIACIQKGKVEHMFLTPGKKPNTFEYPIFLFFKKEMSLAEVIGKFSGIDMRVPGKVRFWRNEKGEPTYIVKKLGEGGMGKVYQFVNVKEGLIGVLKDAKRKGDVSPVLTKSSVENEYNIISAIHQEKKILGIQEKPHTCGAIQVTTKQNKPKERYGYLTQMYGGNYFDEIIKGGGTLENRLIDFYQLLSGLKALADLGFLHGDIKLENIFVKRIGGILRVYIADLGGACHKDIKVENLTEVVAGGGVRVATAEYNAEADVARSMSLAAQGKRSALVENEMKRDVFAMGCVLYMALTGQNPFKEDGMARTYLGFPDEDKMALKGVPIELQELINSMLDFKVNLRPTAAKSLEQFENIIYSKYPGVLTKINEFKTQEGYV